MKRYPPAILLQAFLTLVGLGPAIVHSQTITPSPYWKNQVAFPDDTFCSRGTSKDSVRWVKFTILLDPYDSNTVYFQDSRKYVFHYTFATACLDPFMGMTSQQFNAVTLLDQNQQAILGTVILPSLSGSPATPAFNEYGIQFVRQEPYAREEIRDLFNLVKAHIAASPEVQAFYFPTYEQQAVAQAHREWFESQGISLGSTARWAKGNTCYSQGWALGPLKFFTADCISEAYQSGLLSSKDILLTDGIPAELPFLAGIISLVPSTPNSHVAILATTQAVPFVHLALTPDVERAQQLVGHRIVFSAYLDQYESCDTRLIDTDNLVDDTLIAEMLQLKESSPLVVTPMARYGAYGVSTDGLTSTDVPYVGGKAANFGLLRAAIPDNSPKGLALTFDLWNAFLDQPLVSTPRIDLAPGEHRLFWADENPNQGPTHTNFKLSKTGESVALFDVDGKTLLDVVPFGPQNSDVSFGRSTDGSDTWKFFTSPTPGQPNSKDSPVKGQGVVLNEMMADNRKTLQDPNDPGHYPDWIELYNASDKTLSLNGMYLTDDVNTPTLWQIPVATGDRTLRQEIMSRLSRYGSYPPEDIQGLSRDLAAIRSLFTHPDVTPLSRELKDGVLAVLTDPGYGFGPNTMLRFRSSTNVEDSDEYTGAGLYDSFSGCPADDLDGDNQGPCGCDPNKTGEDGVFGALRQVFASFYNDNAVLERLRLDVNETEVGMALLVHPSFSNDIELANGVATFERTGPNDNTLITLVTQLGAVSVTNPLDASTPEELTITVLPNGTMVPPKTKDIKSPSSLVPLGGTVMTFSKDYTDLADLLIRVSNQFSQVTGKTAYTLDLEYKKVAPGDKTLPNGGLIVKQVRPVPEPNQTAGVTPYLINIPMEWEVFPGEFELMGRTDVFADHRLKSRWRLETLNIPLDANALGKGLFGQVRIEYLDDDHIDTVNEPMALLPLATHGFGEHIAIDTWQWRDLNNPSAYRLQTPGIPTAVSAAQNPIFTLADLGTYAYNLSYRCLTVDVEYESPVLSWQQQGGANPSPGLTWTTKNRVTLWPLPVASSNDVLEERSLSLGGLSIRTSFYYPPPPTGFRDWTAHTAPLSRWVQTTIEGLTTEPIVLKGYYSQTYRPEHHNQVENFLFEPRLEPELSADLLDQLRGKDVRFIHLIMDNTGGNESKIMTHGFSTGG